MIDMDYSEFLKKYLEDRKRKRLVEKWRNQYVKTVNSLKPKARLEP